MIIIPKDVDISPGQAFHEPAEQERNLENLLRTFGKKEATEALGALGKIEKDTWKDIGGFFKDIKSIAESGTLLDTLVGDITEFKQDIKSMIIDPILAPILEEFGDEIVWIVDKISKLATLIATVISTITDFLGAIPAFFEDIGGTTEAHESMYHHEAIMEFYYEFGRMPDLGSKEYLEWYWRKYHPEWIVT